MMSRNLRYLTSPMVIVMIYSVTINYYEFTNIRLVRSLKWKFVSDVNFKFPFVKDLLSIYISWIILRSDNS